MQPEKGRDEFLSGITTKGKLKVMRSRISALMLGAILLLSLAACSKKEQSQNPPAATDTSGQAQTTQPGGGQMAPAGGQMAPAQGQQMAQAPAPAPEPPPPPPPIVVPAGTSIVIRMGSTLDTKTANDGDTFTGSLARAVAVHGEVAIPSGAGVTGTVVQSKSPGKFKGEGILTIALTSINIGGAPESIQTSSYTVNVKGKGKRTAVAVGGGTGAGALIGGIAGGGKGALIGGLVGAGAGTAGAAFTGNKDLQIPAEHVITFKLASSITVPGHAKPAGDQMNQPSQGQPTQ
jgi:predicted small lipoprotein YifL